MKRLIIHPRDRTTDFLCGIYRNLPDTTVIRGGYSKEEVSRMIADHDQVMMMGHGSPGGLFSVGQFKTWGGMIIDNTMLKQLGTKKNNVFIWCHADQFVERYGLAGFTTGMFISEVQEGYFCYVDCTQGDIDESNASFVNAVNRVADCHPKVMHANVCQHYGALAGHNPVVEYNSKRVKYCEGDDDVRIKAQSSRSYGGAGWTVGGTYSRVTGAAGRDAGYKSGRELISH